MLVAWVALSLLHLPCPVLHAHEQQLAQANYVEHVHLFHDDHDETEGDYHWHWIFPEQQSYLQNTSSTTAQLTIFAIVPSSFEFMIFEIIHTQAAICCRSDHTSDRCRGFFTDIFAARSAASQFCKFQC